MQGTGDSFAEEWLGLDWGVKKDVNQWGEKISVPKMIPCSSTVVPHRSLRSSWGAGADAPSHFGVHYNECITWGLRNK